MRFPGLFLFTFLFLSCNAQDDAAGKVSTEKFETAIVNNRDAQVLDVRTDAEFKSGHIKNALLANWNNSLQFHDRIQYLNKKKPVYIYCLSGGRSSAAAKWMRENGYSTVVELSGGINAWKKAGKPLEVIFADKQMTFAEYEALIQSNTTALVDIGAPWCPPCKKMDPVVEELQQDSSLHFKLVKVDAGIHTDVLQKLGVDPIPVFIIYKNGKEAWRKEGIVSKEELIAQIK